MANKEIQPTLRLKDLHKILQTVFNIGCEVELALVESIKKTDEEKTALNLISILTEDRKKIIGFRYYPGEQKKLPVYHWYQQFYVQFAIQKKEEINACLSVELKNVHSHEEGIRELQVIASDLQKIYKLPFTPNIYMNGKPVEQMQQKPG